MPPITKEKFFIILGILLSVAFANTPFGFAQEDPFKFDSFQEGSGGSVEINGDTVEYSVDGNRVTAKGDVVAIYKGATLKCDTLDFYRNTGTAFAKGHVSLVFAKGAEITGDELEFNFGAMTGTFQGAKIYAHPYYAAGRGISKVSDDKMVMFDAYMTTSDFDKPEYRIVSKRVEIYPGDKLVARSVKMLLGDMPILYLPKFSQSLKDNKPAWTIIPGYDKQWGGFLLTRWRYHLGDHVAGNIYFDYRDRLGLGEGADLKYNTLKYGSGYMHLYYTQERKISSKYNLQEKPKPTVERERFKAEWRHKWDIDDKTTAIWQYYKLSDANFLKDLFEKEFDEDSDPDTFFFLTRTFKGGILSFNMEPRVNRFEDKVERLPQIQYDWFNNEIADSGFYYRSTSSYAKLVRKFASPSDTDQHAQRIDSDNELSYPMKLGIFEVTPFVGQRLTHYNKTKDDDQTNSVRSIFSTGSSVSTKFYKIYETYMNSMGLNINRLRHIITPTVTYRYRHEPTITSNQLFNFDGVDNIEREENINFAIENKLQTKRSNKTVELLRAIVSTDYRLKTDPSAGGFDKVNMDVDFRPIDRLTLYIDSQYDLRKDHINDVNFDLYVNSPDGRWNVGIGKRFHRRVDDQLTTDVQYKVNSKWALRWYQRFDTLNGFLKEQEYTIKRDLHTWDMDINFNQTRGEGSEIWIVFTLKAFPDMAVDVGTGFNKRKAGSQSTDK